MALKVVRKPPGLFEQRDPIAPDVLGFYQLADRSYARLSTGMAMKNGPVFLVSVEPTLPDQPIRTRLLRKQAEALAYIEKLS